MLPSRTGWGVDDRQMFQPESTPCRRRGEHLCSVRGTSAEFKRWLRRGATFEPAKGGHMWIMLRRPRDFADARQPYETEDRYGRRDQSATRIAMDGMLAHPATLMPDPGDGSTVTFRDAPTRSPRDTREEPPCGPNTRLSARSPRAAARVTRG